MSMVAKLITKMDKVELNNADLPSARSQDSVFFSKGVLARQSIRAFAQLVVGPQDYNSKREDLLKGIAPALKLSK